MGFFDALLGGGASNLVDSIGKAIDSTVTSDEERLELEIERIRTERDFNYKEAKLVADLNLGQMEILKVDAASGSWFQASWRPMIGWVGALALLYNYLLYPLLTWFVPLISSDFQIPPILDMNQLFPIITGMLGVAGMRSFDKRHRTDTIKIGKTW
jgi:hypothetical protein